MNRPPMLLAVIVAATFSACNEGQVRRVDLEGRGVVTYVIKRPDIGDSPGGPVSQNVKIEGVEAIRFYDSYVVVEKKDGSSILLNPGGVINLEWKK